MNPFFPFEFKPRAIVLTGVVAVVGESTESYLTRVLGRPMIQVDGALPQATLDDLADRFRDRTGVAVTCREDAPMHVVFEPIGKGHVMRPLHEADAEEAERARDPKEQEPLRSGS